MLQLFHGYKIPKICFLIKSYLSSNSVYQWTHASPNNFFIHLKISIKISIDKLCFIVYIHSIDVLFDSGGNYITFLQ